MKAYRIANGILVDEFDAEQIGDDATYSPPPPFDPSESVCAWIGSGWAVMPLSAVATIEEQSAPRVVPEPVPEEIADWQFATILAEDGVITQAEAEDFCGAGVLPATLATALDAIPDTVQRNRARILVRGAKSYLRHNPVVLTLGALLGKTADDLDDIWRRAAALGAGAGA